VVAQVISVILATKYPYKKKVKKKGKGVCKLFMEIHLTTTEYGVSLAVWDHTVLPITRHKRTHSTSTPARQAGTRFTDH